MDQIDNNRLFYYYIGNEKHGTVSAEELKQLALDGVIAFNTQIETSDGKKLLAKSIRNLFDVQVLIKRVECLSDQIVTLEQKIDQLLSTIAHNPSSKKTTKSSNIKDDSTLELKSVSSSSLEMSDDSEIQKTKTLRIGKWYVGTHIAPGRYRVQVVNNYCYVDQQDLEGYTVFSVSLEKEDKYKRSCEVELEESDVLKIDGIARFTYLSEVIQKRKRD